MSSSRTKRPFAGASADPSQRQITSFFHKPSDSSSDLVAPQPQQHPSLPANVQANLISVGMRVRKSVPEGYKTGGYSSFSLWSDADPAIVTASSATSNRTVNGGGARAELLPFCGIHKIGGLSSQSEHNPAFPAAAFPGGLEEEDDDDDMPGLTSSQDSVATTISTNSSLGAAGAAAMNRKRPAPNELDVADDLSTSWVEEEEEDANSLQSVTNFLGGGSNSGRLMAVPRRRGQTQRVAKQVAFSGIGQENAQLKMDVENDFGEADFLDFGAYGRPKMEI